MKDNNIIITLIWTWKSFYILLWLVQRNLSGLWFIFTNISSLSLCGKCINIIYFLVMGVPSLMRPRDLETLLLHLTPSRYLLTIKTVCCYCWICCIFCDWFVYWLNDLTVLGFVGCYVFFIIREDVVDWYCCCWQTNTSCGCCKHWAVSVVLEKDVVFVLGDGVLLVDLHRLLLLLPTLNCCCFRRRCCWLTQEVVVAVANIELLLF